MFGSALASGLGFFTPASTRGGGGGRCTFVSLRFGFAIAASRGGATTTGCASTMTTPASTATGTICGAASTGRGAVECEPPRTNMPIAASGTSATSPTSAHTAAADAARSRQHVAWALGGVAVVGAVASGYLWYHASVEVTPTSTTVAYVARF